MNSKLSPHQLSVKEKRAFYFQELLNDYTFLNKYLLAIVVLVFIGIVARDRVSESEGQDSLPKDREMVFISLEIVGFCLYASSQIRCFRKKTGKFFIIRFWLIGLGNIFFGAGIVCNIAFSIRTFVESPGKMDWLYMIYVITDGIVAVILNDIINPVWYMKLIMPVCYYLGVLVAVFYLHMDNLVGVCIFFISGTLNMVLILIFKEKFRWKLFLQRIEEERWNEIHKVILNKVPSIILVINSNGDIIYNNPEFQRAFDKDRTDEFFQRITDLKSGMSSQMNQLLNTYLEQAKAQQNVEELNIYSYISSLRCSTQDRSYVDGEIKIENLSKLIEIALGLLKKEVLVNDTNLTFYGKLNTKVPEEYKSFEVILTPLVEYQNIILILNDTTQRDLIAALEDNNNYKDRLLASVSHELRTPLNATLNFIEASINHDEVPEGVKQELLVPAYRSGKLLNYLVNDILDYSQLGVNKLRLHWDKQRIRETIKSCYQLLERQIKTKGLEFDLVIDTDVPEEFVTDHSRVTQIILNLLGNALKFTFEGKISLSAQMMDPRRLEITVADTGIGIKPEDLARIFQEFVTLGEKDGYTSNIKGVGLGLAISDKLVKMLNPSQIAGIKVSSTYKEGSTFSFMVENSNEDITEIFSATSKKKLLMSQRYSETMCLSEEESLTASPKYFLQNTPLRKSKETASRAKFNLKETISKLQNKDKKKRILLVDDDPFNILALQSILKSFDVEIDCAYNGTAALDKVEKLLKSSSRNRLYSVIFMDCQMPIMDGYAATREIIGLMNKQDITNVPIIGCTAFSDQTNLEECQKCGMVDVINKPVSRERLVQIWNKYGLHD